MPVFRGRYLARRDIPQEPASTYRSATGDASAGEAVFFGKDSAGRQSGCSGCHEVDGHGANFASDLSAEGTKPAATIRDGVLHVLPTPRGAITPHFVDVTMRDGRSSTAW